MGEVSRGLAAELESAGLDPLLVLAVIRAGLAEDLAGGPDVTTAATIAPGRWGPRRPCGAAIRGGGGSSGWHKPYSTSPRKRRKVFRWLPASRQRRDEVGPGNVLMTVRGPLAGILTAERTALNLLCHMSGVATLTRRWVDAVAGTGAKVRDTRKTLPGLRMLEKYAVRCGGGVNHRMSLSDAALIKDNHVAAAGSVTAAFDAVGKAAPRPAGGGGVRHARAGG